MAAVDVAGDGDDGDEVDGEAPVRVSRPKMQFTLWSQLALKRRGRRSAFPFLFESAEFCRLRRGRIKR